MRVHWRTLALAALLAGCGTGSTPPGGGTSGATGSTGTTTVGTSGATAGSSGANAGSSSAGATSGSSGATSSSSGTSSSASSSSSATSGTSSSSSSSGSGTSSSSGGTTGASACAGLPVPTPGAPVVYNSPDVVSFNQRHCGPGTSDGSGNLALPDVNDYQPHDVRLYFLSASGAFSQTQSLIRFVPAPQASGFVGTESYGASAGYAFDVLDGSGNLVSHQSLSNQGSAWQMENPAGGVVVWESTSGNFTDGTLEAFDGRGITRWRTPLTGIGVVDGFGVDRQGNTLLLSHLAPGAPESGTWVDANGSAHAPFQAFGSSGVYELYDGVGSGLYALARSYDSSSGTLVQHTQWLAFFPSLADNKQPAPAWLTSRPDTTLHMVHGGSGYAVLPVPGSSADCSQTIEIVAADGTSCGSAKFSFGGSCTTHDIAIGYDGTVIQTLPESQMQCVSDAHCACGWRWWPALFH